MTIDIGPHLLGRTVEHDPASKGYPAPMRRAVRPRNVIHINKAPILDQGDLGSCVGNTAAEWLNSAVAWRNRKAGTMPSRLAHNRSFLGERQAVDLYAHATRRDEDDTAAYPPTDCGTSGLGVGKALKDLGFITGYDWTFDFPHFLSTLQVQPVCVGLNWYSEMYDTDVQGFVHATGSVEGGHEVLARGVNFTKQFVLFRNHWGPAWGLKGEFLMSFSTIELLLHEQGDVMVPRLINQYSN